MASAGARAYMGSGGEAEAPEADDIITFETPTLALFFTSFSIVSRNQL